MPTLEDRLSALISAIGADVKALQAAGGGPGILGLARGASVPGGTPNGTLVFEKADWIGSLLDDSPAALISLDETTGNFLDASPNARHFTPGSGVTRGLASLIGDTGGKSASGDGTHTIASLGSAGGMAQTGTVRARISIPASNLAGGILHVGATGNGWSLSINNGAGAAGRQLCLTSPGVNYYGSGYSFPAVAGVYDVAMTLAAHQANWYVDGVKVGNNAVGDTSPGAGLFIGSTGSSEYLPSTVIVDHAAFFPTVLSAARIKQHAFLKPYNMLGWWDATNSKLQPLGMGA